MNVNVALNDVITRSAACSLRMMMMMWCVCVMVYVMVFRVVVSLDGGTCVYMYNVDMLNMYVCITFVDVLWTWRVDDWMVWHVRGTCV